MRRIYLYQLGPCGYALSRKKEILLRNWQDRLHRVRFAETYSEALLPIVINRHNSLIRRKLGNVDLQLQENKAVNLALAAPKINNILIKPGETFSFWHLVGHTSAKKGYKEGLTISNGKPSQGIGGGLCQLTNLIHWMILHTPLEITEHHHHDALDLFPDHKRVIPFGTGTSICYNYLDYRFCLFAQTFSIPRQRQFYCGDIFLVFHPRQGRITKRRLLNFLRPFYLLLSN